MAKTRVYEVARDLGVDSKEVLERALELGLDVKTASSGLDENEVDLVTRALAGESDSAVIEPEPVPEPAVEPEPVPEPAVEAAGPAPEPVAAEATAEEAGEPAPVDVTVPEGDEADVDIAEVERGMSVESFADAIGRPTGDVVKALLMKGRPVGATAVMPDDLMEEVAEDLGVIVDISDTAPEAPELKVVADRPSFDDAEADLVSRPPVVTVMGHVDHGKTTLLDSIRKTNVVGGEEGGITQHIGAYQVDVADRKITFIDTPGHEAFTALRARGANITDIVILVVAADDSVMPQTVEAISHAKAAGVKMVVAINKIDTPGADPLRVRTELTQQDVITEELGGDIPSVEVSAVNGEGVEDLLVILDLIAQLDDYKANPAASASGVVVEAQVEKGRGPVASVIIQRGTLRQGDAFVAGAVPGRVRAMMDDLGSRLKEAGPSTPVQIMGWEDVPAAGDYFEVVGSDREARTLADQRMTAIKDIEQAIPTARERLEGLLEQLRSEDATLRVIIKADAQGSLEALRESIGKIGREGGKIEIVHGAVGGINENDVTLADVSDAVIVGFNVRPEPSARRMAESEGIEIRTYGIIYELLDDIEALLVGQLAPEELEVVLGTAEVRAVFKVPRAGTVAGCYVTEGVVQRGAKARLLRGGVVTYTGSIESLKRFKDDAREVAQGFECGIGLANFNDVKEGDLIEVYEIREIART
ncbi:MAG TPA: translation initiation factor IF-2 [Acidimicrobiia bacterium]|nr:translation initiation factor IF-2 [Acidimicrobiia bacterium]